MCIFLLRNYYISICIISSGDVKRKLESVLICLIRSFYCFLYWHIIPILLWIKVYAYHFSSLCSSFIVHCECVQVWPIDIDLKFMEPVGKELKNIGKVRPVFFLCTYLWLWICFFIAIGPLSRMLPFWESLFKSTMDYVRSNLEHLLL